jgi:hypothetical protein
VLRFCVPGGFGTIEAIEDSEYLAELRRLAQQARYVTSVCSGTRFGLIYRGDNRGGQMMRDALASDA